MPRTPSVANEHGSHAWQLQRRVSESVLMRRMGPGWDATRKSVHASARVPGLSEGLTKLRMGWVGAPALRFSTPAFHTPTKARQRNPPAGMLEVREGEENDGSNEEKFDRHDEGSYPRHRQNVDMMEALMLLDEPGRVEAARHMALHETWTLALRALFLREATALRFQSPYAVMVHGVTMALVSLRWHWELVTRECVDGGSKLGGLGGAVSRPVTPLLLDAPLSA